MPKQDDVTRISLRLKDRFLELIEDSDCSKYEFAKKVGVNKEIIFRATVYGIIPSVKSLIKIADSLNVPINFLLGESNDSDFDMAENKSDFYTRFESLLKEKGEKYSEMVKEMPFQQNSYYEWVRRNCLPTLDYLKEIAKHFDVSIDYLLGRTDYRY